MDTPQQNFAYRPDIDGLRAIAVLAVVAFHLGFASMAGGFLGVDIFFVISGYLITSIIAPKMAAGTFSFKGFYLKRIRRLVPPALVTIIATFIASAFILDPHDLVAMAKSSIAAVLSLSNFLFFSEAGYWDTRSELKPLLHTWSLGVEEQFYIFWPLLVFIFWRLIKGKGEGDGSRVKHLFWLFGIFTILGLVISEWMLRVNPSAAFYLLPARMFQFSMGATAAFFAQQYFWQKLAGPLIRLCVGAIGLFTVFACIWIYRVIPAFPGINAIYPSVAVSMILVSGAKTQKFEKAIPIMNMLIGNRVMTFLGRISYSVYLVHWPVIALLRYETGLDLSLKYQIIGTVLIVILSFCLYFGIEKRISARVGQGSQDRHATQHIPNMRLVRNVGITSVIVSIVFGHAAMTSGWKWRFDTIRLTPEQIKTGKSDRFSNLRGSCVFIDYENEDNCAPEKPIQILVIGDSLEPDGHTFLLAAIGQNPDVILTRFQQVNRCGFVVENGRIVATGQRKRCQERIERLTSQEIANHFDIILYVANKPFIGKKVVFLEVLKSMKRLNPDIKVLTMGSYLNTSVACSTLYNQTGDIKTCAKPENLEASPLKDLEGSLRTEFLELSDVYIDRGKLLCGKKIPEDCETSTPDGIPFMYDTVHLSYEFARYMGQKYAQENPEVLREIFDVDKR